MLDAQCGAQHARPLPRTRQVVNGARYALTLHGSGYRPRLALSWHSHDFGPVHVWRAGMAPATAVLTARNGDEQPVSFEVLWGDREHLAVRTGRAGRAGGCRGVCGGRCHREGAPPAARGDEGVGAQQAGGGKPSLRTPLAPPLKQIDAGSVVLQPGESRDMTVTFRPAAAVAYRETVPLQVNGLYSVNVIVAGAPASRV